MRNADIFGPPQSADLTSDVPSDESEEEQYLTFTFPEGGKFACVKYRKESDKPPNVSIYYGESTSSMSTKLTLSNDGYPINYVDVGVGNSVLLKGTNSKFAISDLAYDSFKFEGKVEVSGNIMSLLYGDDFKSKKTIPADYCFACLFKGCNTMTSAPLLPATTLTKDCYNQMFSGCSALKTPPILPAETIAENCYFNMFSSSGITDIPDLPAKKLYIGCYGAMFSNCDSLTVINSSSLHGEELASGCYNSMFSLCDNLKNCPDLPVKKLESGCYRYMFQKCTELVDAPSELPATVLENQCYENMFLECKNLKTPPSFPDNMTFADGSEACCRAMFSGCLNLESMPKLTAKTLVKDCYSSMLSKCEKLTSIPEEYFQGVTIADNCYMNMFNGCTSIVTAPVLEANELRSHCYYHMFYGCTNLEKVVCYATDITATNCVKEWLNGTKDGGVLYTPNKELWTKGTNVPSTWLVNPATVVLGGEWLVDETWTYDNGKYTKEYGSLTATWTSIISDIEPKMDRTGYSLTGWIGDKTKTVLDLAEMTATWSANSYSIVLNANYIGGTNGSATVHYDNTELDSGSFKKVSDWSYHVLLGYYSGETLILNVDGSFAGKNIEGWIDGDGKWVKDSNEEITLTAKWRTYDITFNANGGKIEGQDTKVVPAGDNGKVSEFPEAALQYHKTTGWFLATSGGEPIDESYQFTDDTEIYAQWRTYDITFNANGGKIEGQDTKVVSAGDNGKVSEFPEAARQYHKTTGWFLATSGGEPIDESYQFTDDTEIYAQWRTYDITFNANGGTFGDGETKIVCANDNGTVSFPDSPTRGEFEFVGWFTKKTDGVHVTTEYRFADDTEIYAQWSIPTVGPKEITTDDKFSFAVMSSGTLKRVFLTFNGEDKIELFSPEDYVSEKTEFGTVITITNISLTKKTGDYILDADFGTDGKAKVTFNVVTSSRTVFPVVYYSNGGSAPAPEAYNAILGETITVASYNGTKDGYAFGGWLYNGVKIVKPGEKIEVKEPITLTAIWNFLPEGSHTVTFDTDGGTDAPQPIPAMEGETFTVPDYSGTKDGYTFKGWLYEGQVYKAGYKVKMGTSDIVMKAIWEKNPEPAPEDNTGMIVGIAVGVIAAVALIGAVAYYCVKKK